MKRKRAIEIRQSEIREAMNGPEEPANAAELRAESAKLEIEYRGILAAEGESEERAEDTPETALPEDVADELDAEVRERQRLEGRVELRRYLAAAMRDAELDGAEAELNAAVELRGTGGVAVPWAALALPEPDEQRQDAHTPAPANVARTLAPVIPRVFATGIARYLGIAMPMVPAGERQYTYLSAGADPEMKAKGAAVDADAATFTPVDFSPVRLTARYLFRREDVASFAGMEAALRGDLSMVMQESMDNQILNGTGVAPNVDGLLATAANGGLDDVANPGAVVTAATLIDTYAALVDGRYAKTQGAVRVAIGAATYAKLASLVQGDAYVYDRYAMQTRIEALMPAAAANVQQAVAAKVNAPGPNAVAPVWEGLELIRDPYTGAAKAEVAVTAIMLWNFGLIRKAGFARLKFKLA